MSIELKIKAKSLAAESKIIRHEIQKLKITAAWSRRLAATSVSEGSVTEDLGMLTDTRVKAEYKINDLATHRSQVVGCESRATHLARAFLAGKDYKTIENRRRNEGQLYLEYNFLYIIRKVTKMIRKYGHPYGYSLRRADFKELKHFERYQDKWFENEVRKWCGLPLHNIPS